MTAQVYVNQIVKKVKCSKNKRKDIRRQILADIDAQMEQGVPLDVVLLRMGEPIAIAEEFNQNLTEQELKKYRRAFAAKIVSGIAVGLLAIVLVLLWFLPVGLKMGSSGQFQEAVVEEQAKKVIRLLDAEDYEAFWACTDPRLRDILTKEAIDDAKKQAGENWGEFQEFGKCYMGEQRQQGKVRAVVQINASYQNIGITYTLLFNPDMKLSGFYIK
ncbi:MAG: DUF3887 domain-containing protein [Eubacterium sp.]|nr:DUF3887 domain-containing protein [Eubacterium sp.]